MFLNSSLVKGLHVLEFFFGGLHVLELFFGKGSSCS